MNICGTLLQHLDTPIRREGRALLLDHDHLLMEVPIFFSQVCDCLLEFLDFHVLVSDYSGEVFKLLHLGQVLVSFFINGRQVLVIDLLHVAQSLLQVHSVPMAPSQGVGELLAEHRDLLLSIDAKSTLILVLVAKHHVFLSSDRL